MLQKYPRTLHLPWSEGITNDDKVMPVVPFEGQLVVVTEKMDGENTSMYSRHIHARSLDSNHHPSRDWVKSFWSTIKYNIPPMMRICGENMFAEHSIPYDNLDSYFLGFSIWEGDNCLEWGETLEWFELLGITPVPILYEGMYNKDILDDRWSNKDPNKNEGYVIRVARSFTTQEFSSCVGKYVRKGHVQTDEHWMSKPVVPNKLKEKL